MMATAVVADHGLDADERAYLNLGLETVSAFRLHWMVSCALRCAQHAHWC